MSIVIRTWLGFAALGVGLIHLALVISSPLPLAIALGVIGATEVGWAVLTLRQPRIASPRLVILGALLPIALWLGIVLLAPFAAPELPTQLSTVALSIAAALELFVAVVIAMYLRRGNDLSSPPRTPAPWLYLTGLTAGALAVGAIVTPALASTAAGEYAQPHGEHSVPLEPPSHAPHNGHH